MTPRRIVAVLSGGGAKAAAHVGACRALFDAGLVPTRYVGTSMGAVIAAALASGLTPDDVSKKIGAVGARGIVRRRFAGAMGFFAPSLLRGEPLRDAIAEIVPKRHFAELQVPLTCTAIDLDTGALVVFGEGGETVPLLDALAASCALPLYYPPVQLDGRRLGDGGIRGVLPLELAAGVPADLVVAIDVGPGFDATGPKGRMPPVIRAHDETTGYLMATVTQLALARWRDDATRAPLLYIRPRIERDATFRVDAAARYADEGQRAAAAAIAAAGIATWRQSS